MADIALINKDIIVSDFGDILVTGEEDDIIQMAINNIMTIYGENEIHPNIGNMAYHGRYKMSENGLREIAAQCQSAIMSDPRVANVVEVIAKNISTLENYGLCDISFVLITTSGAQLNSSVTVSFVR